MPPKPGIGNRITKELLAKFPDAASKTLARRAYQENPGVWSNLEACRSAFRVARGQHGDEKRKATSDKSHYRPPGTVVAFAPLPDGEKEMKKWGPFKIDKPGLWLVISDLHIPFHDATSIRIFLKEAKRRKVVGVVVNGDAADCFSVSRWEKDPRKRNFKKEVKTVGQFWDHLRGYFGPAVDLIWKWGNHEERYDQYMQLKAPELLGIGDFNFARITGAKKFGIRTVRRRRIIKLGKLSIIHGHEYRFAIQNPVNPARGLFLRAKEPTLCGHFHQYSSHQGKSLSGHITTCWSTGCLCDLNPEYMPLNEWIHGAAFVGVSNDGAFAVENYRIIDGKKW